MAGYKAEMLGWEETEWHWPGVVSCGGVHVISLVMPVRPRVSHLSGQVFVKFGIG